MSNASIMFLSFFIIIGFFAIGDILGVATKAKLSSVFVALFLFLVGFMFQKLPSDIVAKSGLGQIGSWAAPLLIFHMGTMINIKELIAEWRTVVMTIISVFVAIASTFIIVPFIGKYAAIVSVPILNGGIIATQIMTGAALEKGLQTVAALGTMVFAIQKFVGTIPASYFGMKAGKKILEDYRKGRLEIEKNNEIEKNKQKISFAKKQEKYYTNFVCIAITVFFSFLSRIIQDKTGLNISISALVFGALLSYLGLLPNAILDKAKMSGFLSFAVFTSLVPSLAKISFQDLLTLSLQLILIFGSLLIGIFIIAYILPTWKLVGSRDLAVGISVAQLLGFPATYLIANEIATALTDDEEEKNIILKKIVPAYVVAGLASVTTMSIIMAGFFVKYI